MKNHKTKKYQSVITRRIWQSVRKLSVVFLMVACTTSLLTVGGTNAGFSDIEESHDNTWTAGSLDARATYIEYFSVVGMNPSQEPDSRITFSNKGSLDFRYRVQYQEIGGDDTLCQALSLTAERDGVTVYTGLLEDFDKEDFSSVPFEIPSLGSDDWDFTVALPADAGSTLENQSCQWSFDFTTWQTNLPDATAGFSDSESVGPHTIATGEWLTPGDVVINEVMWMGSTVSDNDEWIELRNMTGDAISLAGWQIEKAGTSGTTLTIPAGKSIPANGYFLIANYGKSHASSALNVEGDWVTTSVALRDSANGNLVLKSPSTMTIDSALGTPNWGAGNHGSSTPLEQSMERNDIPGDGLIASSWHACVSGVCNDGTYWDTVDGNNFGTPKSANLSPIVLNEFVLNPVGEDDASRPDSEWVELYNILATPIDVAGWYLTNADGDQIVVSALNTDSGETVVPGKGTLVVYLEQAFLDNDADTLSLYAPLLPGDADDVQEDTVSYVGAGALAEGKSYARFPDGEGIWIDPVATPGEENVMSDEDRDAFRRLTFEVCFEDEALRNDATESVCSPLFLTYIGMLEDAGERHIPTDVLLTVLGMIRAEEEKKLLALLVEDGTLSSDDQALLVVDEPVVEELPVAEPEESASEEANDEPAEVVVPEAREEEVTPVIPEAGPTEETVLPTEPVTPEVVEPTVTEPEAVVVEPVPDEPEEALVTQEAEVPAVETETSSTLETVN